MDETLAIEQIMSSGASFDSPAFLCENNEELVNDNQVSSDSFDINIFVGETCDIISEMTVIQKSKLMKKFDIGEKTFLEIYHPGLKKEEKQQSKPISHIPPPKKYIYMSLYFKHIHKYSLV